MKYLISMTDFVLSETLQKDYKELDNPVSKESILIYLTALQRIDKYANFLKHPLELGMFVPVDEQRDCLEEPTQEKYGYYHANFFEEESGWMFEEGEEKYYEALRIYEKAKEKVLFKWYRGTVIEDLVELLTNPYEYLMAEEIDIRYRRFLRTKTIEDLIPFYKNFELTQVAINQIFK